VLLAFSNYSFIIYSDGICFVKVKNYFVKNKEKNYNNVPLKVLLFFKRVSRNIFQVSGYNVKLAYLFLKKWEYL